MGVGAVHLKGSVVFWKGSRWKGRRSFNSQLGLRRVVFWGVPGGSSQMLMFSINLCVGRDSLRVLKQIQAIKCDQIIGKGGTRSWAWPRGSMEVQLKTD